MKEIYTPEQVASVPSIEVARNLARVARLEYALEESHQTDARTTSDWGSEDGRILQRVVENMPSLDRRAEASEYDFAVLYSLTARRPYADITKIHGTKQPNPSAFIGLQMMDLEKQLAFDGYERVGGMFEKQDGHFLPTVGVFAAGALHRASIKHEVDREVYDRRKEILAARKEIEAAAPQRVATKEYEPLYHKKKLLRQRQRVTGSVFSYNYNPRADHEAIFETQWWWDELGSDLVAIDAAAEKYR